VDKFSTLNVDKDEKCIVAMYEKKNVENLSTKLVENLEEYCSGTVICKG